MRDLYINIRGRGRFSGYPDNQLSRRVHSEIRDGTRSVGGADQAGPDVVGEQTCMESVHDGRNKKRGRLGGYENLYPTRMMAGYMVK